MALGMLRCIETYFRKTLQGDGAFVGYVAQVW